MASKYWIKLYHEMNYDPKVIRLSDRLFRRTIQLFLLAGEVDKEGLLPSIDDMAITLRTEAEQLETELVALSDIGIVSLIDTSWVVTKFAERQAPVGDAERMRRYRERKQKQQYYGDDTEVLLNGNDNVTIRNADTDVDTDTDVDVEVTTAQKISSAFVEETKIPELTGGPQRWHEALKKLTDAGVEPDDVRAAISEMREKNLNITSLSSVVNPSIISMSKRKSKPNTKRSLESAGYNVR